jgi:hypothetical protein
MDAGRWSRLPSEDEIELAALAAEDGNAEVLRVTTAIRLCSR